MIKLKDYIASYAPALLLVIILYAAPAVAPAPGQLTGSATSWNEISITAPSNISDWDLIPEITNIRTGTLNVDATGDWKVEVKDADSATSGHMTKYEVGTGTYDTGVNLGSAMNISAQGGNEVTLSATNQLILTGVATPQGGQDTTVEFEQPVSFDDSVLDSGYAYRLVVTFTGSLV